MLSTWNETGIALANHLWQSTAFAVIVGSLTLFFRRNSAAVRYRLWLVASVKFLLPFSLFVAFGSVMQWHPVHPVPLSEVPVVVRQIGQPFTPATMRIAPASIAKSEPVSRIPFEVAFAIVWFGGALLVMLVWFARWLQLVRIVRRAEPLEIPALPDSPRVRILSSTVAKEPGVFGIVRPALLLPVDIARTLSDAQLNAVIAHEVIHVRRRDNLAAAVHTAVQALFWFHPLVWWLGNRLVDERERACDEAVLQSGHAPEDYAEGILKVCRSNVMTPACLAGVSGSNLRKRIEVIMENQRIRRLTAGKKSLLILGAAGVLIVPVFAGMMTAAEMQLRVIEREPGVAQPVISVAVPSSVPQAAPAAVVQLEPKTGDVQVPLQAVSAPPQGPAQPAASGPLPANFGQNNVFDMLAKYNEAYKQKEVKQNAVLVPAELLASSTTGQAANGQAITLGDASIIATDEERKAFQQLAKDEQRQEFITSFWLVRDPTPGTPANEFKEEFERRVAYANEHFSSKSGARGSQTDRGKMYILNGPPDEIVSHPSGGTYYRPADQGGGVVNTFPFETWRYFHVGGKGDNVVYEFVDRQLNGEYTLEYDPSSKPNGRD
jgi:GWxTD domain-containing protein